MEKNNKEVLEKAIATFGYTHQSDKTIEELAELINAIMKFRFNKATLSDVASEIADVEIMVEQFKMMYCCYREVEMHKQFKIDRLEYRLGTDV